MDSNVTGKVKDAITSKLAGEPELKRNVIKYINKAEQTENEEKEEKGYLSFLKDPNDLIEIYKIIKSHKISIKEKRKKIKEFLKPEKELNDFFNKILSTKSKTKEESKEATGAGSAGGYEAPLFSEPNSSTTNVSGLTKGDVVKTVREQLEKVEAKEATSSSSSGQYNQPAIWAKSLSKKNWKGATTKYMPGAKRVQVKKKCKTFPYCNQGDINALNLTNESKISSVITKLSEKYNISEDYIKKLILQEYYKGKQ